MPFFNLHVIITKKNIPYSLHIPMIYIWQIYMTDYIWLLYYIFQTLEKVKESQNVKKWKWLCLYKNWLKHITDALVYTWPLLALHQLQVFLLRRLRELHPMQLNVLGKKRNHLSEALPQSNLQRCFLVGPTHTKRDLPYNLQCSANHAINLWPTQPTPDPEAF